ncbi:protein of unknown function [Petrocella atlantisensis]|uniref:Uncharacterized protein n=1 Tax=Petrocella atlantisensis TaxID=2173034 RepID=A0A3P7P642_9FIRM|nr:protein of unknown function [Petrocella atlantisensis]
MNRLQGEVMYVRHKRVARFHIIATLLIILRNLLICSTMLLQ